MPTKTLSSRWIGVGGPTSIREGNECQRRRWALKGGGCDIPHWLGRGMKHSL